MRYLLFSLLFTVTLPAQQKDTLALKTYQELSDLIREEGRLNLESAKNLSTYYIQKAKRDKNILEEIKGLERYIHINIIDRKFNQFEKEEQRLIQLAIQNDLENDLMMYYYSFGNDYFYQGIFSKAIDNYYKSLNLAKKLENLTFKHLNLKQIGYLNYFTGKLEESTKLQKQAFNLLNTYPKKKDTLFESSKRLMKLSALELLTRTYIFAKEKDSAKAYNSKALNLTLKEEDSCYLKGFLRQKAQIHILEKSFDSAKKYLEESKKYCYVANSIDDFLLASEYGKIHLGLKEYDQALNVLNTGIKQFNLDGQEAFTSDYFKLLAIAYKHKGNLEQSNYYFEKFVNADEQFGKIKDSVSISFKKQEVKAFKEELNAIQSEKDTQENYLKYLALGATLVILVLLFFLLKFYKTKKKNELKFQELLSKVNTSSEENTIIDTKDNVLEESTTSDVNEETTQQILSGLKNLEAQEYYLKQDCNSYNVAKKIKTNTSYLSKVVNSHYQKNFNTYINDLRINYAIVRLKNDSRFRSFSIQSIAEDLGYKSADSFAKYFKQHTGLNPSFYIKQLNNLD